MNFLNELFSNQALIATLIAWFFAQSVKVITDVIREKKFKFKQFALPGGFPSSHSAAVSALATSIGLNFGFDSALFAISIIFAGVVISDAQGIRRAAGKQAEILNRIIEDFYMHRGLKIEYLKELLGHTPFEVFIGILFGIAVAIILNII